MAQQVRARATLGQCGSPSCSWAYATALVDEVFSNGYAVRPDFLDDEKLEDLKRNLDTDPNATIHCDGQTNEAVTRVLRID